jgi:predicted PurR-regulated permease PerM
VVSALISAVFSASVVRLVSQLTNEALFLQTFKQFRVKLERLSPVELDKDLFPENPTAVQEIGVMKFLVDAAPYMMREVAKYSANWTWQVIVILFITFFVLLEGRMLARRAVAIFGPSPEVQDKATEVLFEMAKQVRTYLVWRTLINLVLAIVMGLVYQSCGLKQAWTWAILLAILNYIPYFGPVLASIPPFLDAFIFSEPEYAVIVTIIFWIVVVIEGYLVVPLVMGRNMDLNATTVMLACLFWELVWGTTGLFLAMPIMAGVKAILYNVPELRVWANLMSTHEDPETLPEPPSESVSPLTGDSPNGKPGVTRSEGVTSGEPPLK